MICPVHSIKYLGILVDSKLMWKPHIAELSKKSARTAGIFFRMRHFAAIKITILFII